MYADPLPPAAVLRFATLPTGSAGMALPLTFTLADWRQLVVGLPVAPGGTGTDETPAAIALDAKIARQLPPYHYRDPEHYERRHRRTIPLTGPEIELLLVTLARRAERNARGGGIGAANAQAVLTLREALLRHAVTMYHARGAGGWVEVAA